VLKIRHIAKPKTVTNKPKKNDSGNFAVRKRKNETANPQNNTFASSDTQAEASACKRVVFLPTHRRKIDTTTWIG